MLHYKKSTNLILSIILFLSAVVLLAQSIKEKSSASTSLKLPAPNLKSNFSLEQALNERRSIRNYSTEALTLKQVSQLLWSAQGITDSKTGHRTAPSAMATYPLELYVAAANVKDIPEGLYRYQPKDHSLVLVKKGDVRPELSTQPSVKEASAVFLFTGVKERLGTRFGDRGSDFIYLEAGHAAENLCLQATALKLGTVTVGGFDPAELKKSIGLPAQEEAIYLLPVGKLKK